MLPLSDRALHGRGPEMIARTHVITRKTRGNDEVMMTLVGVS